MHDFIAHQSVEKEGVLGGLDHTLSIWPRGCGGCGACSYPVGGGVLLVCTFFVPHHPTAPARARDKTDSALPELHAPPTPCTCSKQTKTTPSPTYRTLPMRRRSGDVNNMLRTTSCRSNIRYLVGGTHDADSSRAE
jgi:hypothetical protein